VEMKEEDKFKTAFSVNKQRETSIEDEHHFM
jgi:hypothetical protein